MTAVITSPAASRQTRRAKGLATPRLLWLELRHNAMAWLVPVAIGLFWLTTYRKTVAMAPFWYVRADTLQLNAMLDFAIPVTGAAAWMGSREARGRLTDQVTITARPRWARLLIPWAATTIWALTAYLGCVAWLYVETARQAPWGGPLWWPVAVPAVGVAAFAALGFVVGTYLPSRFTAPLATIATFFILALSTQPIHGSQSYWNISPIVTGPWDMGPQPGVATFYPFVPDLSIAQVMLLGGLTVALLGALGLPAGAAARSLRAAAAGLTGAGLLAAGTAVGLAGTGTLGTHGMIDIPALHDAASDRPFQYTPVCSRTAIPVCLNPAYAGYLAATAHALAPLLNQLAGLPGAPARIVQDSVTYQQGTGNCVAVLWRGPSASATSLFSVALADQLGQPPGPAMTAAQVGDQVASMYAPDLVTRVIGDRPGASQAQNAVGTALEMASRTTSSTFFEGSQGPNSCGPEEQGAPSRRLEVAPGTPAYAAAQRFAALPPATRHAWLMQHAAALRAGQITLAQLP
jgi:hypothetical protein